MFLVIPMMLLTSGEVIGRALWDQPIPGTLELSSYLLAVFILTGLAYTHQVRGHVRVEMITSRLPARVKAGIDLFTTTLCLFIVAILIWQGFLLGIEEKAVSDMLRIPQWPFKLFVSVAALMLFLEFTLDFIDNLKRLFNHA
jgi:TRAP-type C4-dicarboxylate transport system permease small subunit